MPHPPYADAPMQGRPVGHEDRGHRRRRRAHAAARQRPDATPTCRSTRSRSTTSTRTAWRSSAAWRARMAAQARVTLVRVARRVRRAAPTSSSPASASAASSSACTTRRSRCATASSARRRSGPAGFAMAARTIPQMVRVRARDRRRGADAPGSSTSPTRSAWSPRRCAPASDRVIGICDTPTELFEEVAHALGLRLGALPLRLLRPESSRLAARGLQRRRAAAPSPVERRRAAARRSTRCRCSSRRRCASCGCCRPSTSTTTTSRSARSTTCGAPARRRGQAIAELTDVLFESLARRRTPTVVAIYESYLLDAQRRLHADRVRAATAPTRRRAGRRGLSGYDKIALGVVRAIHFNAQRDHPAERREPRQHPRAAATTTSSRCRAS